MVTSKLLLEKKSEINRKFNLFIRDTNWINNNLDMLRKKYPNKYIAVYNRKIILTDKDLTDLKEKLKEENVAFEKVAIEFVKDKPIKLLV